MAAYDAIVLGLGGMGSATLFHLARRGLRVLGLERFDLVHEYGSSHGLTRIIRLAYWEHPTYVTLLRRAYDAGPEGGAIFEGALRSSEFHGLEHEVMDGAELHRRFPGYRLPKQIRCLYQPEGGFLLPERCDIAHIEQALAHAAEVHCREPVLEWVLGAGVCGCARPADGLAVPERQVLAWLQPARPEYFRLGAFPVFNLEVEEGRYYGFPSFLIPGFKFGKYHHRGQQVDPDAVNREPEPEDEELLRAFARRYFPDGAGPTIMLKTCLFTNSPDRHFILDHHPAFPEVAIAAEFSGHGYKFCSVIGEVMADLAQGGQARHDTDFFRLKRFVATP